MSGVTFEYNDKDVLKMVDATARRIKHNRRIMGSVGGLVRESIRTNFADGGRPHKWRRLKRRKGQPLRDTGRLQNSIASLVPPGDNRVIIGTNVKYAAMQNFGAKQGSFGTILEQVKEHQRVSRSGTRFTVRAHTRRAQLPWGTIPAREFMLVQHEDEIEIKAMVADYILEGKT